MIAVRKILVEQEPLNSMSVVDIEHRAVLDPSVIKATLVVEQASKNVKDPNAIKTMLEQE